MPEKSTYQSAGIFAEALKPWQSAMQFNPMYKPVNERSKLTRFQRLNLTHPLWRKGPRRAALI